MNRNRLRLIYILFDIIAALITWALFMYFRKTVNDAALFDGIYVFIPNYNFYQSLFIFPVFCLFIHYLSGVYLYPEKQKQSRLIMATLISSVIISVVIFFALLLDDIVVSYQFYYRALLALLGLLFFTTYLFRAVICYYTRKKYKSGQWKFRTAIIGTGNNARKIATELGKKMEKNKFVGFITESKNQANGSDIIGNLSNIEFLIKEEKIQEIIIAFDDADERKLFTIINSLFKYNIEIRFTPGLYEILIGSVKIDELRMSPLVSVTASTMKDWEACVKRFFDILLSFIALLILLPLFLILTICIKIDSEGPAFFKQERIGKYGHFFKIVKFRTMYVTAEKGGPRLSSPVDPRVTCIGRFLRKYRLDELPQFWNVLKGEMSLVGPRPERQYFINKITKEAPYYCLLYKIRPGLTSWGPIRIGYADTIKKMVERLNYDIIYMENMSLRTDLKILLYTVEVIFKGKGV